VRNPKAEGNPNALKNINHYNALLQASMIDMINPSEGSEVPQLPKSFSQLDFRLGPDKLSNLYSLSNKHI